MPEQQKPKPTPGPWHWDEPTNWIGLEARIFVADPYGMVARVPIEAWRPKSIGRANARLIAAAPTMLAYIELRASAGDVEARHILEVIDVNA